MVGEKKKKPKIVFFWNGVSIWGSGSASKNRNIGIWIRGQLKIPTDHIFQKLISRPTKNQLLRNNLINRFLPKKIDFLIFCKKLTMFMSQKNLGDLSVR